MPKTHQCLLYTTERTIMFDIIYLYTVYMKSTDLCAQLRSGILTFKAETGNLGNEKQNLSHVQWWRKY